MLLRGLKNDARAPPYAIHMAADKDPIADALAHNVRVLMARRGWKQEKLAEKAGMSQTHVGNVLRKTAAPTSVVISKLARAFGVSEYVLVMPDLPDHMLDSNEIPSLLKIWIANRGSR